MAEKDYKTEGYDPKIDGDITLIKVKLLQDILAELKKLNGGI